MNEYQLAGYLNKTANLTPGLGVRAKKRTQMGISDEYVSKGTKGTLVVLYKSLVKPFKWRWSIKWGQRGESSHLLGDIELVDKSITIPELD